MLHEEFELEEADISLPFEPNNHYVRQAELIIGARNQRLFRIEKWFENHKQFRVMLITTFFTSTVLSGAILFDFFINRTNNFILLVCLLIVLSFSFVTGWVMARANTYHAPARAAIRQVAEEMRRDAAFVWMEKRYGISVEKEDHIYEALFTTKALQNSRNLVQIALNRYVSSAYIVDRGYILVKHDNIEMKRIYTNRPKPFKKLEPETLPDTIKDDIV